MTSQTACDEPRPTINRAITPRIIMLVSLVTIVGVAALGGRQLSVRPFAIPKAIEANPIGQRPGIEVVSTIPRSETGKYDLRDVALLENGDAWAVGYDGQHVDRVYFSKDIGKTWQPVDVPGTGFTLNAISFSDSQHGWAVGGDGLIIRTRDGGLSWELLKPPIQAAADVRLPDLHAVQFANASVGYLAGNERFGSKTSDEVWGTVEVFCTKDGGDTWRQCYKENEPDTVFQITTVSESRAFFSLGDRLLRTDDQGQTWHRVSTSAKYISAIAFAPEGSGWLVGSHGVFQTSPDGGKTWQQPASIMPDFGNRDWQGIAFNEDGTGLAVGENSTLAVTTDSGKTWQLQTTIKSDDLRAIQIQNTRAVILGSHNAYSIDVRWSTISRRPD